MAPPTRRRRRPVTQSGNLNPRSGRRQQVGTGVVQSGDAAPPRPARSPNPAAAVLTGEERMLSFGDPHMVPARELRADPVFRFQSSIRSAAQLAEAGMRAEASQIPTNYQMQQLGTATIVSRRGGSIRTAEWEQGEKVRRQWERMEYELDRAIRSGEPANPEQQARVTRARQAFVDSPLFDTEGSAENVGKPFFVYQHEADGTSILPPREEDAQIAGAPTADRYIGRGSNIQQVPRVDSQQQIDEAGGRIEFGQTAFTRTADAPGYGAWQGRPMTTGGQQPRAKGPGFLGTLQRPDGQVSTELSIGVEMGGKEMEIPTLVPGLTGEEKQHLLQGNFPTPAIVAKAVAHAKQRMAAGKGVFAGAPTREERAEDARARATKFGVPTGTRPVTPGMTDAMKARISRAKTPAQKDALIAKLKAGAKRRNIDLSTSRHFMSLAEGQFKRGAKKRLGKQEQQDITGAFTDLPPDRAAEMVDRLNTLYDRSTLMKNKAYRQALVQYDLKAPKQKTGKMTAAKKAALRKNAADRVRGYSELLIGKKGKAGDVVTPGLLQFAAKTDISTEGKKTTTEAQTPEVISETLWETYQAQISIEQNIDPNFDVAKFDREWLAALTEASRAPSAPDLVKMHEERLLQEPQRAAQTEQFINEGGPSAQQPAQPAGGPGPFIQAIESQTPQRPNMGTSPVLVVTATPSGLPDFPDDLSSFTFDYEGKGVLVDEQAGVKLTVTADGRRYWTHVVMRGGKQVSQSYLLEGGPPPNGGVEPAAEGGAAGKPAAKAAPAGTDLKKQLQTDIDQALSGGQ